MNKGEIVQTNYWKEMRKDINETVENIRGIVLLTHNSVDFSDVIDFLNRIKKNEHLTVLYISLINSYNYINQELQNNSLESKRLFVVDCVSKSFLDTHDGDNYIYRETPNTLKEMKNLIKDSLKIIKPNIIVVDSLSQYINFTTPTDAELNELYQFLHAIKEDILGITCYAVILLYDDKLGPMRKLPTLFTDLILKLEVIKENMQWMD